MKNKNFWKMIGKIFKKDFSNVKTDEKWQKTNLVIKVKNVL